MIDLLLISFIISCKLLIVLCILNNQIFHFIDNFNQENKKINYKNINIILEIIKKPEIEKYLKFKKICKSNGYKIYLFNDLKISNKVNLDGVYIPSFNKRLNIKSKSKETLVS